MEMPTFKEKSILKINNLTVNYCVFHDLQYTITSNGWLHDHIAVTDENHTKSHEIYIANKLMDISDRIYQDMEINESHINFCNEIANELQESKESLETA